MVSVDVPPLAAACGAVLGVCVLSWLYTTLTAPGFRVADKHVFITGGSSGLGLSLAKQYARAGAKVTIVARNADALATAKREIEAVASGPHAVLTISCDVCDYAAVQRAVAQANAFHERVTDHVVCNAGASVPGLVLEQDVAVFRQLMDLNYFGALHTVKAALPAMVASPLPASDNFKRRVVLVSSAAGLTTFIGYTQYSSTKYAMRGLGEALRNELLLYGIATSIFYPGNIDTPCLAAEQPLRPPEAKQIDDVSGAMHPDDAAAALVSGIGRGEYAITNEWLLQVLRTLANGVAPRANTPLEMLLLPLCVVVQTVYMQFFDWVVLASARTQRKTNKMETEAKAAERAPMLRLSKPKAS